jgi:plastocyanin domain-containing protein
VIFLFALGQIDGALTVFGSRVTLAGFGQQLVASLTQATTIPAAQAQEQVVQMTVAYGAYSPSRFVLRKNVPVRWEINGVDVGGCADTITAPSIGITRRLQSGLNLIQFTPNRSGTIPFSCGMGMIRGSFTVVD